MASKKVAKKVIGGEGEVETVKVEPKEKTVKVEPKEKTVKVETQGLHITDYKVVPQKLKNINGEEVDVKDYFYANGEEESIAPNFFNKALGYPITYEEEGREDMIETFSTYFRPGDNFILLKQREKEVYSVLVPLKFAKDIGVHEDSILGDFQIHSMSFVQEGGFNLESFKSKLSLIKKNLGYV